MRRRGRNRVISTAAALALLLGSGGCEGAEAPVDKPDLGLSSTLPIYWNETAGIGELLQDAGEPPWPRTVLAERFDLVPLDSLAADPGLGTLDALLLVQPRALSAAENVALDDWVRGGGRVLLFADPLLTAHSRFHIGDRRRPQDVVLLSPILARWGLELEFDPEQPEGERLVDIGALEIPVNFAGRLGPTGDGSDCTFAGGGLVARCRIGEGHATIVADAALFETHEGDSAASRKGVLDALTVDLVRESREKRD